MTSLAKKPQFVTRKGTVLYLQPVPFLLLMDFMNESNAPQPPMKPVPNAFGRIEEPDYEDETYKAKYAVYDSEKNVGMLRLCAVFGVSNDPSADDPIIRALRAIDARMSPETLKVRWIEAMFTDQDELQLFIEEIIAQTVATEEALEVAASEERFRSVGGRETGNGHRTKKSVTNRSLSVSVGATDEGG